MHLRTTTLSATRLLSLIVISFLMISCSSSRELFNGENLEGWETVGNNAGSWVVTDGILHTQGDGRGWLSTTSTYDDFVLDLEYRMPEGGNSGVFIRAPREGSPSSQGMEIQILDDYADKHSDLENWQYTGSIYFIQGPSKQVTKPAGEWQTMQIVADGPQIQISLNGEQVVDTNLEDHMDKVEDVPGITREGGYIGLQNYNVRVDFRNIRIREL